MPEIRNNTDYGILNLTLHQELIRLAVRTRRRRKLHRCRIGFMQMSDLRRRE